MNVLFLMIVFPDVKLSSNLYTELAEEFRDNGHNVFVATIVEKKHGQGTKLTRENGMSVLRIKTGNLFSVGSIEKGITTLTLGSVFNKALDYYFKDIKFDLLITPTPPITFADTVKHLKKRDSSKAYLILRDIFPQNSRDLELIKSNLVFSYFRKKEKKLYAVSDYIGCMSQGNIEYVIKHNPEVDRNKLELLPNWTKLKDSKTEPKEIDYKEKYGLKDKFVLVFGGNIGWAQELEFLLELAHEYKENQGIVFLIIGNGICRGKIEKIIHDNQLNNVVIKEQIPRNDYDGLIKQCDVGLINLDRRFTIPNIPSKTLGYFEAEIPVLASTDSKTDYKQLLEESGGGLWSETGNMKSYKSNFELLKNDEVLRKTMGKKGNEYLRKHLTVEKAYTTIIDHFNNKMKKDEV